MKRFSFSTSRKAIVRVGKKVYCVPFCAVSNFL